MLPLEKLELFNTYANFLSIDFLCFVDEDIGGVGIVESGGKHFCLKCACMCNVHSTEGSSPRGL